MILRLGFAGAFLVLLAGAVGGQTLAASMAHQSLTLPHISLSSLVSASSATPVTSQHGVHRRHVTTVLTGDIVLERAWLDSSQSVTGGRVHFHLVIVNTTGRTTRGDLQATLSDSLSVGSDGAAPTSMVSIQGVRIPQGRSVVSEWVSLDKSLPPGTYYFSSRLHDALMDIDHALVDGGAVVRVHV